MLSHLLLQPIQFVFFLILILIALPVLVGVLVLLKRLQLLQSPVRSQSLSQAVDEQEEVRGQVEATVHQLAETREQLVEARRQVAALGSLLTDARRQQEETQGDLAETRAQLEETRKQLAESQAQFVTSQKPLREPGGTGELEQQGEVRREENLLNNVAWIKLTQECVALYDELDRKSVSMDPQRGEIAGYVCSQLEEILERCGVTIILGDSAFDESRHRPYPAVSRYAHCRDTQFRFCCRPSCAAPCPCASS